MFQFLCPSQFLFSSLCFVLSASWNAATSPITFSLPVGVAIAESGWVHIPWDFVRCVWLLMDSVVDLAETSPYPSTQVPTDLDCGFQSENVDGRALLQLHVQLVRAEWEVEEVRILRGHLPLCRKQEQHLHKRFEDPIGPSRKCWSSLAKSVLNGMCDITVISLRWPSLFTEPLRGSWYWRVAWMW